jgi:hypothetical protein
MALADQALLIDEFRSKINMANAALLAVNRTRAPLMDVVGNIGNAYDTFYRATEVYALRSAASRTQDLIEGQLNAFLQYVGNVAAAVVADQNKIIASGGYRMVTIADVMDESFIRLILDMAREVAANLKKSPRLEFAAAGYSRFSSNYKQEGENLKKAEANRQAKASQPASTPEAQAEKKDAETAIVKVDQPSLDNIRFDLKSLGTKLVWAGVGVVVLIVAVRWWRGRRR